MSNKVKKKQKNKKKTIIKIIVFILIAILSIVFGPYLYYSIEYQEMINDKKYTNALYFVEDLSEYPFYDVENHIENVIRLALENKKYDELIYMDEDVINVSNVAEIRNNLLSKDDCEKLIDIAKKENLPLANIFVCTLLKVADSLPYKTSEYENIVKAHFEIVELTGASCTDGNHNCGTQNNDAYTMDEYWNIVIKYGLGDYLEYTTSNSSSNYSGYSSNNGNYDRSDKYYSANDYNQDGYLSDDEFRGAVSDYLDDYYAAYPNRDPGYDY